MPGEGPAATLPSTLRARLGRYAVAIGLAAVSVGGLHAAAQYSYLLFHTSVELFRVLLIFGIFVLAWHTRRWSSNGYLLWVGVSYLFVGVIELLHTLAYRGMGVFPAYDANLPTQLWIAFRALEGLALLVAPAFVGREPKAVPVLGGYAALTVAAVAAIYAGIFPDCFVEGRGLTAFKIVSEYVIAAMFLAALLGLVRARAAFAPEVVTYLAGSLLANAAAEIAFTQYVSVYGLENEIGHFLLLVSSLALYRAILFTGLVKPYTLLFRDLQHQKEALEAEVAAGVERTAALNAANEKLESVNKELETFAYSVSHDLRAPLRAVDGFSRILIDDYGGKLDDEGRRLLNVVSDGAKKMARMIEDILQFSRTGRQAMSWGEIDMEAMVRDVFQELAPSLAGRDVTLDLKPLPRAWADGATIRRVWANLLDNAVKFTAHKPQARIEVGADKGTSEIVFYVRDDGAGFDMSRVDKLFGVFQRLHDEAQFPGTDIGLAIVKRIVSRHGGRVWAEGKIGAGATFFFTLPLGRPAPAPDPAPSAANAS